MNGETKQTIQNIRAEFRRNIGAKLEVILNESATFTEEEFIKAIQDFERYLESIDVPVEHQVPPLGVSVGDIQPSKDMFGH